MLMARFLKKVLKLNIVKCTDSKKTSKTSILKKAFTWF